MRRAAALLLSSIALVGALAGCGSRSDGQVSNDFTQLLLGKGVLLKIGSVHCAHVNGNQYTCGYRTVDGGGQRLDNVTDDGHTIAATPAL